MNNNNFIHTAYPSRRKIIISSLFVMIFLTSILITLEIYFPLKSKNHTYIGHNLQNFYSQDFSKTNNIVLIGSSHTGMINSTVVQKKINSISGTKYVVYNIAFGGDTLSRRLSQTDEIVAMKPKLILYGISYRDLLKNSGQPETDFLLEKTKIVLSKSLNNNEYFENPQRFTRLHLFNAGYETTPPNCNFFNTNTPFYPYCLEYNIPKTFEELKQENHPLLADLSQENLEALHTMLDRFNNENIKTVLFITPVNKLYIDDLTDSQKTSFDYSIRSLEEKYGTVYDFRDKYDTLPIWYDTSHIIVNNSIYDLDIAKIILEKLN